MAGFPFLHFDILGIFGLFAHVGPGDPVTRLRFRVQLDPDSNGIDPQTEPVALGIGGVTLTIPPGSFRREHDGAFRFVGRLDHVNLAMEIAPSEGPAFEVTVKAEGLPRPPGDAPVLISLTIGDDIASVLVAPPGE